MEVVRYRPADAVRWLQYGAENLRREAVRQTGDIIRREGNRSIGQDIKEAAGAILGMGKSALAEIMHSDANATEYVLQKDRFDAIRGSTVRSVRYKDVVSLNQKGDKLLISHQNGSLTIRPPAHITSARVRVPIGWARNGIEVPYEMLLDELSARCGVEIEYE